LILPIDLAERRGGDDEPAREREAAQRRHRELAADDHRHDPGWGEIQLYQRDERRGNQELVGDRVEHLADPGDLAAPPRQVAVEPVGQGGQPEDCRPDNLHLEPQHPPALELGHQHHHEQRHQEDPGERERVGQVHGPVEPGGRARWKRRGILPPRSVPHNLSGGSSLPSCMIGG
jgi:hypothetical protein